MERPKVGVGVLVFDGSNILLGKRKNAHGSGCWAPPGGHLEYGESWEECAHRELLEETGLVIDNFKFYDVTNNVFHENHKHYVTIFMTGTYQGGEVKNLESEKCEGWHWVVVDQLPQDLFPAFKTLVENRQLHIAAHHQ